MVSYMAHTLNLFLYNFDPLFCNKKFLISRKCLYIKSEFASRSIKNGIFIIFITYHWKDLLLHDYRESRRYLAYLQIGTQCIFTVHKLQVTSYNWRKRCKWDNIGGDWFIVEEERCLRWELAAALLAGRYIVTIDHSFTCILYIHQQKSAVHLSNRGHMNVYLLTFTSVRTIFTWNLFVDILFCLSIIYEHFLRILEPLLPRQ